MRMKCLFEMVDQYIGRTCYTRLAGWVVFSNTIEVNSRRWFCLRHYIIRIQWIFWTEVAF